ncbi:uncharacterized protein BXZ73DRAFT_79930 [Epithele typhae]|uniref:uncharacterized protein n=1 Tax=Epithele typhae TaxID=378194 RepID=UPI002007536C|nr:uncharacterized protein BXZ73DRAFT_79930 [Epithele typhae]KAH9921538.1 hypothetical protein BXZ73DRAFT_79930 [Epithele typhae]
MGQRHQAFLIARVRPHGAPAGHPGNRRCIAAIHHQWCYGSLPLNATRRFIDLIRQPLNAAALLSEVRNLDGKYGAFGNREPTIPDIPCPYTTSLFATAWSTNLETGEQGEYYSSGFCYLDAPMGCWDGDNNDGITIIDVTDPYNPKYCFMVADGPVLDAPGYLVQYYEDVLGSTDDIGEEPSSNAHLQYLRNCMRPLRNVPLIPSSRLQEAWPYERFSDPPASRDQGVAGNVPPSESGASDSHTLTARKAVETGCIDDLVQLSRLPDGAQHVKDAIGGFIPYPDNAMDLLEEVLRETHRKHPNFVDLSGIQLSREQILRVLSGWDAEVNWLDVSNNASTVVDDIVTILAAAPRTRVLNLIGCSSVEDAPLLSLVRDYPPELKTLEGILHPALLDDNISEPGMKTRPSALTIVDVGKHKWDSEPSFSSLALFTPAQVVQSLTDLLPMYGLDKKDSYRPNYPIRGITEPAALQGCARGLDDPWGTRTVANVPLSTRWVPATRREDGDGESVPRIADAYQGEAYHLKGFLECMAQEGRPLPTAAAVDRLEGLLDVKDEGGHAMFPFLSDLSLDRLENN